MKETLNDDPTSINPEKESGMRMLKRLRILLILWLLSFIATVIWFTISPNT